MGYIYAAGVTLQRARKILTSTMATVKNSDIYGDIYALAVDDIYVYVGGAGLNKVRKILKADMSTVLDSANYLGEIDALAIDDTYVYCAGAGVNKVRKILKADMTTVLDSIDYAWSIWVLAVDDTYIYFDFGGGQKVRKILKSTMATVLDSADYGGSIRALAVDDIYIYAGGATLQKVRKILRATMATVLDSAAYGGTIYALAQDATYIYAAGGTTQKVWKIRKSDMVKVSESAAYGGTIRALAIDDAYIYAAGDTTQKVRKILKADMTTVLDSADYGGFIRALTMAAEPTVVTNVASDVLPAKATLNGNLVDAGGDICTLFFEWGPSTALGSTAAAGTGITGALFSANITGLLAGQIYYFRAGATNSWGTSYGAILSFVDPPPGPGDIPTVLTLPAVEVTENGGKLEGFVQDSVGEYGSVRFQWGGTTAYGNTTPWIDGCHTGDKFSATLLTLAEGAVYHYRAQFKGSYRIVSGSDAAFTTLSNLGAVTFVDEETMARLEE